MSGSRFDGWMRLLAHGAAEPSSRRRLGRLARSIALVAALAPVAGSDAVDANVRGSADRCHRPRRACDGICAKLDAACADEESACRAACAEGPEPDGRASCDAICDRVREDCTEYADLCPEVCQQSQDTCTPMCWLGGRKRRCMNRRVDRFQTRIAGAFNADNVENAQTACYVVLAGCRCPGFPLAARPRVAPDDQTSRRGGPVGGSPRRLRIQMPWRPGP